MRAHEPNASSPPRLIARRFALPAAWLASIVIALLAGYYTHDWIMPPAAHEQARSREAAALFSKAKGQHPERLPERMDAARKLAAREDGQTWTVLLLSDARPTATPSGDDVELSRARGLRPLELAVTAATIEQLPKQCGKPLLWALTLLLGEQGVGRWSGESGFVLVKRMEFQSAPIRDLARERLKKRLGVDQGYDAAAWQAAILGAKDE